MAEIFSGFSEFGRVLADYITRETAVRGAVLSDDQGDAVDLVFDEDRTTALEVQILGAQLDRAAERLSSWFQDRGRGPCEILIEASHGRLCCAFVGGAYVLAVVSEPAQGDDEARAAEAERVLAGFRDLRRDIEALLQA
ncbi:hypothetical protein OV203_24150 [Nannocystis sp. ILAH1]|uniref:hypothetical protein n=1 Tax=unclassified Nannocystis TaxID=2627009 RepID=UPI00227014E9|nr:MULTISPECIES: hypothetical protein [unclassified Nannocystis]MCY0990255.1 hypothetical protein [Nannocystis sp. ILAH1]MCY1069456.1 hypothetical protein [Nannocystis sp. RBIL2]